MVDFKYSNLFLQDSADKQLHIEFDTGTITNEELHSENFELNESLCSEEQLRFGSCESSSIKFKISNIIIPLKDKQLVITETLGGNTDVSFSFGEYKVHSDKPTANRKYRDITAYDAMYDILNAEVSAWYNTILPNKDSTVTMKVFRCSFLDYLGIEYEDVTLANDDMIVAKTVEPTILAGKTVITAICEINGCFGHIGRDGKFQYIHLKEMVEGVYPSDTLYPSDDLYPADPMNVEEVSRSHYTNVKYEDFTTARINKLLIRKEENDVGATYPSGNVTESDNCYIVQDNFLLYGKSTEELEQIAGKMFSVISKVWYQPAHVEAKGNPCLEVGDGITLETDRDIIYTYILQRTLKGIQALRDTYDAEGEQYQKEKVNSTREEIIQLKGRTNLLKRTIEENRLEVTNLEEELSTQIAQNARKILLQAQQGEDMQAQIALNAQQILLKVNKDNLISQINLSEEEILIEAQKINLKGLVEADELVSKFATLYTLNAIRSELEEAIIGRATIGELNVQTLRVDELEAELEEVIANYVKTSVLESEYATVYSVLSVDGKVEAVESKIDKLLNDRMMVIGYFGLNGEFNFMNKTVVWGTLATGETVLMELEDE